MQVKAILTQNANKIYISDESFSDDTNFYYPAIDEMPEIEFINENGFIKVSYGKIKIIREYLKDFDFNNRKYEIKIYKDDELIFDDLAVRVEIDNLFIELRLITTQDYETELLTEYNDEILKPFIFGNVKNIKLPMIDENNLDFLMPENGYAYNCFSGSNEIDYTISNDCKKAILWYKNNRDLTFNAITGDITSRIFPTVEKFEFDVYDFNINGIVETNIDNSEFKIIDNNTFTNLTEYKSFDSKKALLISHI